MLRNIGVEFQKVRETNRVAAWQSVQRSLMQNIAILVPSTVSLKDLLAACTAIEDMLKGEQGDRGKSPSELLAQWLNDTREGKVI